MPKKDNLKIMQYNLKITKFDNDIFLDFQAAGESFAGSTIRLRMALFICQWRETGKMRIDRRMDLGYTGGRTVRNAGKKGDF